MTIESYSIETISPSKRPAIWAVNGNKFYPVCYLQKPKWMSDEQFQKVIDCIKWDAPQDILDDA